MSFRAVRDYLGISLGALLMAAGLNMFLVPNKVADGGVSGLATVLHYLFNLPVGAIMLAINIPLFAASIKVLGARFGVRTLFGAVALSAAIDIGAPFMPVVTQDLLLSSLYGGILIGVGMGVVFRCKGTTAGTDVAAAILNKLLGISVGQSLLMVDFFVIAFAGIAFHSAELSLYGLLALFISTQVLDLVQEGISTSKACFIMTENPQDLAKQLMAELGRGATFFHGSGAYTGQCKDVIFCVVSARELAKLKEVVYRCDKRAFVIVADAHEVLGEGFTEMSARWK